MQHKMFFPRLMFAAFALLALLALAACGSPAAPQTQTKPVAPSNPMASNPPVQPVAPSNPPSAQPTAPAAASGEAVKPGGEGAVKPEGGPAVASVTNPGGLPPSAAQTNNMNTGQETMVLYRDTQNRYQVLFINGWTTGAGNIAGSIKSSFQDRSAQIAIVNSDGKSAMTFATADEANVKSVPGYQRLALKPGQIPYGPVASLIYRYQTGQNPVTGKPLEYIAARVYVPRAGSNDLAIITVTGPATWYDDLSNLFDGIVNSFKWM
jgi:hypothetical protein